MYGPPICPPENLTKLPLLSLHSRSWGANRKGKALLQATALQMRTLGAAAAGRAGHGSDSAIQTGVDCAQCRRMGFGVFGRRKRMRDCS